MARWLYAPFAAALACVGHGEGRERYQKVADQLNPLVDALAPLHGRIVGAAPEVVVAACAEATTGIARLEALPVPPGAEPSERLFAVEGVHLAARILREDLEGKCRPAQITAPGGVASCASACAAGWSKLGEMLESAAHSAAEVGVELSVWGEESP